MTHNAPFDIGFLNHELNRTKRGFKPITEYCSVIDTLVMARQMYPGQRNSLDALCKRYSIDNAHRTLHGALLDSEILADVYLAMTGGQVSLMLGSSQEDDAQQGSGEIRRLTINASALRVIRANDTETAAHIERLAAIEKTAGRCLWQ